MQTPEPPPAAHTPQPGWLHDWTRRANSTDQALARFDGLPEAAPEAMIGRWRGCGLRTDHPLDGLLEALGWYGKAFDSLDRAFPLLFRDARGGVAALDPAMMPVGLALRRPGLARSRAARLAFAALRPALRTRKPAARLAMIRIRDRASAAMIYDRLPIVDHFRRIDDDRMLGLMEMRAMERPFFFLLTRDA